MGLQRLNSHQRGWMTWRTRTSYRLDTDVMQSPALSTRPRLNTNHDSFICPLMIRCVSSHFVSSSLTYSAAVSSLALVSKL